MNPKWAKERLRALGFKEVSADEVDMIADDCRVQVVQASGDDGYAKVYVDLPDGGSLWLKVRTAKIKSRTKTEFEKEELVSEGVQ